VHARRPKKNRKTQRKQIKRGRKEGKVWGAGAFLVVGFDFRLFFLWVVSLLFLFTIAPTLLSNEKISKSKHKDFKQLAGYNDNVCIQLLKNVK